jgi:hypothetical protein
MHHCVSFPPEGRIVRLAYAEYAAGLNAAAARAGDPPEVPIVVFDELDDVDQLYWLSLVRVIQLGILAAQQEVFQARLTELASGTVQ